MANRVFRIGDPPTDFEAVDLGNGRFALPVAEQGPAAPATGLVSNIADTAVATVTEGALPAGACTRGVLVQASPSNTVTVRVGAVGVTAASGTWLEPGATAFFAVDDSSDIHHIAAVAGQVIAGLRL
jgi:hypothetical protein